MARQSALSWSFALQLEARSPKVSPKQPAEREWKARVSCTYSFRARLNSTGPFGYRNVRQGISVGGRGSADVGCLTSQMERSLVARVSNPGEKLAPGAFGCQGLAVHSRKYYATPIRSSMGSDRASRICCQRHFIALRMHGVAGDGADTIVDCYNIL